MGIVFFIYLSCTKNFRSSLLSFRKKHTSYREEIYMKFKSLIAHAVICIFVASEFQHCPINAYLFTLQSHSDKSTAVRVLPFRVSICTYLQFKMSSRQSLEKTGQLQIVSSAEKLEQAVCCFDSIKEYRQSLCTLTVEWHMFVKPSCKQTIQDLNSNFNSS